MPKFKCGDIVEIIKPGIIGYGLRGKVLGRPVHQKKTVAWAGSLGEIELVRVELRIHDMDMEVDYSEDCVKKISYRSIDEGWDDGTKCTQSSGSDAPPVLSDVQ